MQGGFLTNWHLVFVPMRLIFYLDSPIPPQYDEIRLELTIMTLDSEQLRRAMRAWTTGVTVVTATHDGQQYGMTVNSFTSISLEPPLVSLALKKLTHTHELVEKSGEFAVTILAAHQKEYSDRFAGKLPEIKDRFEGVPTETLSINAPLLKGGIAYFNCRVVNAIPVGENTLFVAEVIAVQGEGTGEPLVYHNRVYWNLKTQE
jgi:flavin reductase (DIM6/NTAB) family NADH-FMN oxidoreductase RutF